MKIKTFILTFLLMSCPFLFGQSHWDFNEQNVYPNSMGILAKVSVNSTPLEDYELGAFVNGELRGSNQLEEGNNGFVFLSIHGNGNETVTLKAYDKNTGVTYENVYTINFNSNLNNSAINIDVVPVAQVGSEKVYYTKLSDALAAANDGETLTFLADITEDVTVNKNVTLNMANFKLTGNILAPNAELTVANGTIDNDNKGVSAIEINAGTLTLTNVNISSERHAVRIDGAVTATIDGGTYKVLGSNKGTYHAVNVSGAANVTILNGTFDGPKGTSADSGSAVNVQSGAEVIIKGGEFSGGKNNLLSSKGTLTLTGGTYDQDVQDYCAYGYMSLKGNDGKYTVVEAAARIGEKYYKTFDAAYKAAKDGDVVELFRTAVIDGMIVNYNTKNITVKAEFGDVAFRVQNARLATFGGMTIKSNDYCIIVGAANGSTSPYVDITGGTYEGVTSAISVTKGDVQILDGTFKVEPYNGSYEYTINCIDANYKNNTARVSIKGGKFYNFNPQNNAAEGAGTDFLTGDYTAVQDAEGWYSVGKGVARVVTAAGKDKSYATLLDAIKAVKEGEHIELLSNITLDYNARDSYETRTQNIVIDGKGYVLTLNQKNSDWASIGLANGSKLVLSNMTIEKTGYGDTSGAWNTHAIIFSCPLEMNDVTVNNGIAVQAGATLNDVTINEDNGYYGLWINGNGQEVTVNGGAINATNGGRGIKIADQYIDAPAQVTLNVDGTVFNTAKKAAVLVTSTAGAEITATDVDITNVASDNTNFACVDEARANYFANVTLNNGNAYVEGGEESYEVSAKTDDVFGYYKKLETALAANNTSDITILRPITIANGETRVLDLNGKTVTGTDNGTASYGLFTNKGNLTINDTKGNGKITLTATNNRGWNAYSSVISNTVGGKLTVNGGTIEHLGGTDMAYGIDNLTNGKGTYAETVVEGGTVKSTYRAIRQFLNGIEAQNILTVNGGTIEGANKSIWMQDPSANANSGKLTVGENASLKGDAYLTVTAGSTDWPVQVSIAAAALKDGAKVLSTNVPAKYQVKLVNDCYKVVEIAPAAKIGDEIYYSLAAAINACSNGGEVIVLRDATGAGVVIDKDITIDFNGFTYTFNEGVGSTSTESNGFQILNGNNVTLKNGTLDVAAEAKEKFYILVQNYADLNVTNMTLDGTNLDKWSTTDGDSYVLSNNSGTVNIEGTTITANDEGNKAFAFDVCDHKSYQGGTTVNVANTENRETVVTGKIEVTGEGDADLNISGGLFTTEIQKAWCAEGYVPTTTTIGSVTYYTVTGTQTFELAKHWNWFSSYLNIELSQLQTALGTNGLLIKHNDNTTSYEGGFWLTAANPLTSVEASKMYMIQTSDPINMELTGEVVDPSEVNITLQNNWNWIGYPLANEYTVKEVMKEVMEASDFTPIDGDQIKSHLDGFAQYMVVDGEGNWYGTLKTMKPGCGYMYGNNNGGERELTFAYPENDETRGTVEANITAENNYWVPTAQFASNMTMIATLGADSENYELAAFVNGEVRGSARPIYVEALDAYMFFLTIHGEGVEEITFKCYDIDTDTEYTLNERVVYSNDAVLGSVREPYVLRGTVGMGEVSANEVAIYPNPTTTANEIMLSTTCDKVEVFNSLGVKVAEYQNVDAIEAIETAGVYVIRVTNNDNVQNCRLVVK